MKRTALKKSIFEARLKNRESMLAAAEKMDKLRKKYGKPDKSFDSVAIVRRMRDAR